MTQLVLVVAGREWARRADRWVLVLPQSRTFAELLIDCEEDKVLRAVLVGMLREAERAARPSEEGRP